MNRFLLACVLSGLCLHSPRGAGINERIWVDAKVNGQPVRLAYDTGASFNQLLFLSTAQRLGLKVTLPDQMPDPGKIPVGSTELCDLSLGAVNARVSLNVLELPAYYQWAQEADGVVGWPALSNNIIRLDLAIPAVAVLKDVPGESLNWGKFRIPPEAEILKLEISDTNGKTAVVVVDTGKDRGVVLHPKKWRAWKAAHTSQPVTLDAAYMPATGLVVKEESFAHKITLGPLTLTEVPVMEANAGEVATDPKFAASLGVAALKRLDMIIDGPRCIVYVRPRTAPAAPYDHNRLGAVFVPRDSQSDDLVARVAAGSPADEAGIRQGDVLLKIDELDVTRWRTDPKILPFSRFWNRPAGTRLKLTLKRNEEICETTVKLRNILPPDAARNSD